MRVERLCHHDARLDQIWRVRQRQIDQDVAAAHGSPSRGVSAHPTTFLTANCGEPLVAWRRGRPTFLAEIRHLLAQAPYSTMFFCLVTFWGVSPNPMPILHSIFHEIVSRILQNCKASQRTGYSGTEKTRLPCSDTLVKHRKATQIPPQLAWEALLYYYRGSSTMRPGASVPRRPLLGVLQT